MSQFITVSLISMLCMSMGLVFAECSSDCSVEQPLFTLEKERAQSCVKNEGGADGMIKEMIRASALDAVQATSTLLQEESLIFIDQVSSMIVECYQRKGKLLIAGNGGSLCDAMHFAEELTGFYRDKRKALAAIALSDPGHMSCVGNDVGYHAVFSRALEALGAPEDVFIGLTTSGNSRNIVHAIETAKKLGMKTVTFLGKEGGLLKGEADLEWIVSGFKYSDRVQEAHMAAIHIIIEMVEKKLSSIYAMTHDLVESSR